jgi:hypothetical protein
MWRDSDKSWTVNLSTGSGFVAQDWTGAWGSDGPIFTGDLNGDGKTDVFMWRDSDKSWTVNLSTGSGFVAQRWLGGCGGDGPVVIGDFNQDGRADIAIWRNDLKKWVINLSLGNAFTMQEWTGAWGSDGPIFTGDLNGDGNTDVFMWRDSDKSWTINLSAPVPLGPPARIPGCGDPLWQPLGPYDLMHEVGYLACGGRIDAIAISPDYDGSGHPAMFIGNPGGGVMRWSSDFPGSSSPVWEPLTDRTSSVAPESARIGINAVTSLAVHPNRPQTVVAATQGEPPTLVRSDDGGTSWHLSGQGQLGQFNTPDGVTIDSQGRIYVACGFGLYVSEDDGQTFRNIATGPQSNFWIDDVVSYDEGGGSLAVFAAVLDYSGNANNVSGIWQVIPSGGTYQWSQVPFTLKNMNSASFDSKSIAKIKLSATPGAGVVTSFTTGDNNPGLLNVFRLIKGASGYSGVPKWFTPEQFFTQAGYVMGVCIGEDGRTYGGGIGLGQGDDTGNVTNLQGQFGSIHVDEHVIAAYGGKIYAGTDGGLFRFTPQPGVLGAASRASWEALNSSTLENFLSESVAYNPVDPFNVLAGHQDNGVAHLSGNEWDWLENSNESDFTFFDPNSANGGKIAYIYDASNLDFLKSYDGGTSLSKHLAFSAIYVPNFLIAFHPVDQNRFLVNFPLSADQFTVKETTDGWEDPTQARDLAPPINGLGCPTALCYAGSYIYVAAAGRILQSDGTSWKTVFESNSRVVSILADPNNPAAVYFATDWDVPPMIPGKVYLKPDQANGLPWQEGNGGDLVNLTGTGLTAPVSKLALISGGTGRSPNLYAATPLGMFRTRSVFGTQTDWARMGNGFPDSPIWDLQVNADNRMLYVATYGRGVWYTIDLTVSVSPLSVRKIDSSTLALEWEDDSVLQQSTSIPGTWADVLGATSPQMVQLTGTGNFYRLRSR